ncbi:hypothetical protein OF83DRAFT_1180217 [Amylostereum chailletii]|nr:hypothetical protein OF83DRAFT_1180217 [Amylostereum chailletii]
MHLLITFRNLVICTSILLIVTHIFGLILQHISWSIYITFAPVCHLPMLAFIIGSTTVCKGIDALAPPSNNVSPSPSSPPILNVTAGYLEDPFDLPSIRMTLSAVSTQIKSSSLPEWDRLSDGVGRMRRDLQDAHTQLERLLAQADNLAIRTMSTKHVLSKAIKIKPPFLCRIYNHSKCGIAGAQVAAALLSLRTDIASSATELAGMCQNATAFDRDHLDPAIAELQSTISSAGEELLRRRRAVRSGVLFTFGWSAEYLEQVNEDLRLLGHVEKIRTSSEVYRVALSTQLTAIDTLVNGVLELASIGDPREIVVDVGRAFSGVFDHIDHIRSLSSKRLVVAIEKQVPQFD